MNEFSTTIQLPRYVGHWEIGGPTGMHFSQTTRPRWLTRLMSRWLLQWEWCDGDQPGGVE